MKQIGQTLFLTMMLVFGGINSNIFAQRNLIEIADGRNLSESPKPPQSETQFVKNEVKSKEQAIKNIAKSQEFRCDENDAEENLANENAAANLSISGGLKGAFTRLKSSQKIYFYQICWSEGGIIIVEKEKIVSHFVYVGTPGIDFLRVLPDINRNGFAEIVFGFAGASGLIIWRSLEIVEIGAGKTMSLGEAQAYEMTDDENLAYKIRVKASQKPVFYREIYTSNRDHDTENWKLKERSKRFSLARMNAESKFGFEKL